MIYYDLSACVRHTVSHISFSLSANNTDTTRFCAMYVFSFTLLIQFPRLWVGKVRVSAWLQMSFLGAAFLLLVILKENHSLDLKSSCLLSGSGRRVSVCLCYVGHFVWTVVLCGHPSTPRCVYGPGWADNVGDGGNAGGNAWGEGACIWVSWQLTCPWASPPCHCWIWARVAAVAP